MTDKIKEKLLKEKEKRFKGLPAKDLKEFKNWMENYLEKDVWEEKEVLYFITREKLKQHEETKKEVLEKLKPILQEHCKGTRANCYDIYQDLKREITSKSGGTN